MLSDNINKNYFLKLLLDIGEMMLKSGAEVNRVEDSLDRMGRAYGAKGMNTFAITSSIVLTARFGDDSIVTQTRRIEGSGGNDFIKLEALNELSRECCANPVPLEELERRLEKVKEIAPPPWRLYVGSMIAAGSFAVFFGGRLADGIAAALVAALICFMQLKASEYFPGAVIFNLAASFISGLCICGICAFIPSLNSDMIMIGDIMLLIPGIAITTAVRDTLIGDTLSGSMRLMDSLVKAGAIAGGFMLAIMISRGWHI
ncbi:MAG: threonine/serine exporter family protein [Firmicutes bacterium]|nr:threonine/serine exporter family protein [Bacillota bacterium]MBQ5437999.1 threonine/serine exporter family protein [Bacillota bacterium]MBQ6260707.1 threonine/serine exporter family protein [Bacillota bacterium]MBR0114921.1 threonine/serine exporter family protein [Bacillota bacterium]MBR0441276.1 threonine/serine exporter family protein [Bacillota bacterium]